MAIVLASLKFLLSVKGILVLEMGMSNIFLARKGQRQVVSRVRIKMGLVSRRESGISLAKITTRVGICSLAFSQAFQWIEKHMSLV
jgi:hypothetical protein